MILPTKHINFSQSLMGLGAFVLSRLESPKTIDELWECYLEAHECEKYWGKQSLDNLVMTLLFLYGIGCIAENDGVISKCA